MMLMLWWFGFVKIFGGGGGGGWCESWREEKIFPSTARRNINMGNWRESKFSLPLAAAAPHIIITITINHRSSILPSDRPYYHPSISPLPDHYHHYCNSPCIAPHSTTDKQSVI
jgi:hypothetical protein